MYAPGQYYPGPPPGRPSSNLSSSNTPPPFKQGSPYQQLSQEDAFEFPVLTNLPPNVPPSDQQREEHLEYVRLAILNSNDPDHQVAWAQDALSYVEICIHNEARNAVASAPRACTPGIEHQLLIDAMKVVTFLAEQHHPRAEFITGTWMEFGKFDYPIDKERALQCYINSSERGYARSEYRIGMYYENVEDFATAIQHYERGMEQGDSASHFRLGMMTLLGQHQQPQDYALGMERIRFAAQECDENAPQGAYIYGMLLAKELPQIDVPDEYIQADPQLSRMRMIDWARVNIEKAAFLGFAKAQTKMGSAYELCQLGCDFDPQLSLHYNVLAARQGEPEAEMAISKWFLCGHEGLFEKNDEIAFKYAKRAATSKLPTAEFAMGYFYEVGISVQVDIAQAREWYSKAASSGNRDASGRIDSISRSKTLSRKDHEQVAVTRLKSTRGGPGRGRGGRRPQPGRGPGMASQSPVVENPRIEMPAPSRRTLQYPENGSVNFPAPYAQPVYDMPYQYGSTPAPPPQHYSPAAGTPPRQQPTPQNQQPYPALVGPHEPSQSTPALNIGFSAPYMQPQPAPTRAGPAPGQPGRPYLNHSHSTPTPHDAYGGQMPMQPNQPPYSYPMQHQAPPMSAPVSASAQSPGHHHAQSPAPLTAPASSVSSAPPKSAKASSQASLPGKGPKTFEEMGVPQQKAGTDCIVM